MKSFFLLIVLVIFCLVVSYTNSASTVSGQVQGSSPTELPHASPAELAKEMVHARDGHAMTMTAEEAVNAQVLSDDQLEEVRGGDACMVVVTILDDGSIITHVIC